MNLYELLVRDAASNVFYVRSQGVSVTDAVNKALRAAATICKPEAMPKVLRIVLIQSATSSF